MIYVLQFCISHHTVLHRETVSTHNIEFRGMSTGNIYVAKMKFYSFMSENLFCHLVKLKAEVKFCEALFVMVTIIHIM